MSTTTLTDFRRNMKTYFERVLRRGRPLLISRPDGKDMVVMSRSEYDSMQETFHLLRSPKNAERLQKAIKSDKAGKGRLRKLRD